MRCDGSPDPVNQGEINTYINLRLEDNTRNDADSVLKDCQLDLSVCFCCFFALPISIRASLELETSSFSFLSKLFLKALESFREATVELIGHT